MRLLALAVLGLFAASAWAQEACRSQDPPDCAIYTKCYEANCHCAGTSSPYTATFGPKYCSAFSKATGFSASGNAWRDRTLRCLVSSADEAYARQPMGTCDCGVIQDAMVDSHSVCYTAKPNSFCSLSDADVRTVAALVDPKDLFGLRNGIKEIVESFLVCVDQRDAPQATNIVRIFATQYISAGANAAARSMLQATAAQADAMAASAPQPLKGKLADFANRVRKLEADLFPIPKP